MATMRRKIATLVSVAAESGVSRQTVSNAINAPDRVAAPTLQRVRSAIDAQQYRPNRVARSLRTRTSHLLGYCVPLAAPGSLNPVLDRFAHAIAEAASARGYHVLLFTTPDGGAGLDQYAELLAQRTVDGFILSDTVVGDPRQGWLSERGVPFVAFGRSWRDVEIGAWVDVDGAAGVARAVEHVHELGHRRISFIGWPAGSGVGDDRLAGYESASARLGVEPTIVRDAGGMDQGQALASQLLDAPDPPTALICVSDVVALGALRAASDRRMRPGHDIAIVGFDDMPFAGLPGVELTSISQPIEDAGRVAVRMLLAQLDTGTGGNGQAEPVAASPDSALNVLLQPSLVVRSSTQADPAWGASATSESAPRIGLTT